MLLRCKYKIWGEPTDDSVRIMFGQKAYREVAEHSHSNLEIELGGVLLGTASHHGEVVYVDIIDALPAHEPTSTVQSFSFDPHLWSAIEGRVLAGANPGLKVIGWYHTHPGFNVFFSAADVLIHRDFFKSKWHVALVVDPVEHHGEFFVWDNDAIRSASGFYELFDVENDTILKWRNKSE